MTAPTTAEPSLCGKNRTNRAGTETRPYKRKDEKQNAVKNLVRRMIKIHNHRHKQGKKI